MILPPHRRTRPAKYQQPTDFARQVFESLPLAHASLALFAYGVPTPVLADLFHRHRGRCYEDVATFPQLVDWIFDALIEHRGSGRQAHLQRHRQQHDAGNEAFYGKLRRVPPRLSEAFLRGVTDRFTALFPQVVAHRIPTSFDRLDVIILDGKSLKKVAKRLVETRGTPGKLLGGKLLVAYRPRDGLVLDMASDLDGETNEAKLIPHLMPRLRARPSLATLVVGDRLFCGLKHFDAFPQENGHFVVRHVRTLSFEPDPNRPAVATTDASHRTVIEEWGWAGKPQEKLRRSVRRITVERPTDEAIAILTDRLEPDRWTSPRLVDTQLTVQLSSQGDTPMAKTRTTYTAEFELQAVRMATDQHLAVAEVARRPGITEGRLHDWLQAFCAREADTFPGHGRLASRDAELHRLRAEVQRLEAERDIPKKAAADFARHSTRRSLS